ncbi:PE family protein, partial [Salmonella enterica]
MSYVIVLPEIIDTAATDLAGIGSALHSANATAAARTTGLLAAAQDE